MFFMRKFLFTAVLCLAAADGFCAEEITLALKPAYTAFIRGEAVVVQLELVNMGRQRVQCGPGEGRLFVEVSYQERNNTLQPVTSAPFSRDFTLNPGAKHISKIQLDKWFNLLKEGKYLVNLIYIQGETRYESGTKAFDVVPGIPLKEGVQMFVSDQSLKRIFRVVRWNRNQSERLFLRIEDKPSDAVWDAIDLGPHLKSSEPKLDISDGGEVTVVHRATQDAFHRTVVWSLPESVEIAERNTLLDPEVSASERVRALYGDTVEEGPGDRQSKKWWEFWR
jgi:hypothetical protein